MSAISSGIFYNAVSALNAFSVGMAVTAHNLANVSTPGFRPHTAVYETGAGDQGVRARPTPPSSFPPAAERQNAAPGDDPFPPELLNPSRTDPAREFTRMISEQRSFEANTVVITTWDETLGTIIDMKA